MVRQNSQVIPTSYQGLLEETGRATPFQWKMNWRPTLSIRITALNLGIFGQTFISTLWKSCLVLQKNSFGGPIPMRPTLGRKVNILTFKTNFTTYFFKVILIKIFC